MKVVFQLLPVHVDFLMEFMEIRVLIIMVFGGLLPKIKLKLGIVILTTKRLIFLDILDPKIMDLVFDVLRINI
jgi:hypothetical protein